jgi:hypothetical protein
MLIGFEIFFAYFQCCWYDYTRDVYLTVLMFQLICTSVFTVFGAVFSLYSVTVLASVSDCTCLYAPLYFCTCTCSCAWLYLLVCATIPTCDCTSTCVCVQLYPCVVRNCTRVLCTTIFVCMLYAGVLIMVRVGRVRTWGANAGPHVLPCVIL